MIKAVIFDFDGVIADSRKTIFKIYKLVCMEMGKKFYDNIEEFTQNLDGNYKNFYLKLGIKESEFAKANEIYKKHFLRLENEIRAFHEVADMLASLKKRGIKIGISSNTHEFIIRRLLKNFGFEKYINAVVGGKDIDKLKPDPAQILLAIDKLGVKRSECAFVGDMEVDMIAGRRAKIAKVVAVTYGYHPRGRLEKFGPDAIVSSPHGILDNL
jgi:HAD superfamily hydrolase (TIGR01549 family)